MGIPMCHHPKRFSEDCIDFNMHEEKEIKESEKPVTADLEEPVCEELEKEIACWMSTHLHGKDDKDYDAIKLWGEYIARHFAKWGAEHLADNKVVAVKLGDEIAINGYKLVYDKDENAIKVSKVEPNGSSPKWRRIKAGQRLPCPAYLWSLDYDKMAECWQGRLIPNVEGVKVGTDTWYLPVDVIHNLPKED